MARIAVHIRGMNRVDHCDRSVVGCIDSATQDIPVHIWAQLLAANMAFRHPLDRGAVLGRDASTLSPHAWRTCGDAYGAGQRTCATSDLDRPDEVFSRGGGVYHVRDFVGNTIVMQDPWTITHVNSIGDRLKEAREKRGLSQAQLATAAGVSQGTIGNIEAGSRKRPRDLLAIAAALGVDASWLQDGLGTRESPAIYWTKDQSPDRGVAHQVSPTPFDTPPIVTWEELMHSNELPELFSLDMPDDSMAPRIERGTSLIFSTTDQPGPGKGVLVRDNGGHLYVRRYRQGRGPLWQAQALNDTDFETLDSDRDGLVVVAVLRGVMSGRL